ncbi:MAG: four helix bundle protein [Bacteroidales bacterium]|nr:four helix bundle protein [Bacteroidales bacterium]
MEEKNTSFFRFEDLRIYGKAVDYSKWLISVLQDPRTEGEKSLCSAFVNSAIDIALNIAEGSSRSKSQFDHYLKIAKSAIRECITFTAIAKGSGLLSESDSEHSRELLMEQTRMIGALIISLQRGSRRRDDSESMGGNEETGFDTMSPDFEDTIDDLGN